MNWGKLYHLSLVCCSRLQHFIMSRFSHRKETSCMNRNFGPLWRIVGSSGEIQPCAGNHLTWVLRARQCEKVASKSLGLPILARMHRPLEHVIYNPAWIAVAMVTEEKV